MSTRLTIELQASDLLMSLSIYCCSSSFAPPFVLVLSFVFCFVFLLVFLPFLSCFFFPDVFFVVLWFSSFVDFYNWENVLACYIEL